MSHLAMVLPTAAEAGSSGGSLEWPTVILILGLVFLGLCVWGGAVATRHENRKLRIDAGQEEALRALVDRYEQLAAATLDAQQRTAADVAEMRVRAASIEQILRSVE